MAAAKADLRSGKVDFAIIDGSQILLNRPASSNSSPADPGLVQGVAGYLGVLRAFQAAGLTPAQATQVDHAQPVPVQTLQPGSKESAKTTSVIGLVLLFFMLTQYTTWILIGVMQEKSSRVVEVLLATVRPIQLLGGKVLGIGLVALGQATLIVGFALIVGAAVGSDLLHGTAPLVLAAELLWLILGYAFYSWVYAAAGVDRRAPGPGADARPPPQHPDPVGLHLLHHRSEPGRPRPPLQDPRLSAPDRPVLHASARGLSEVTWWGFVASVLISVAGTAGMAIFAARIYRRAVLRTGARVKFRELFGRTAH